MKRVYLHPLALRIWHWANALIVIILIITGIQVRLSGMASIRPHDPALVIHKYIGWLMIASFIFWLSYGLATHTLRRNYTIAPRDLPGMLRQIKYYLVLIFKGEENPFRPSPEGKFNPLQKMAYSSVMGIFAPVLIITGLLFIDISLLRKYVLLWDIAKIVNAIHVAGAYIFVLYLIIHIYMATVGRTVFSHIKAMIVGYEEEPEAGDAEQSTPAGASAESGNPSV